MIHPNTELRFISKEVGYGVIATAFIPKGSIIWVLDKLDREFTPQMLNSLEPSYQEMILNYTFRNNKGNFVLCWDNGRYINHSFKPNCMATAYNFEIAVQNINAGEQLTDDYGFLNIIEPFEAIDEGCDRKIVYPDDLLRYHKLWDKQIQEVFYLIPQIEQPLMQFVPNETKITINKILNGEENILSILSNLYQPK